MKASELKIKISEGALSHYAHIYSDLERQRDRYLSAIDGFISLFGDLEAELLSVPGRSEISGNHTDHNRGCVLAGAIDRDVIAVAAKIDEPVARFFSEGYPMSEVTLEASRDSANCERYTSSSLIAGMINGFEKHGYKVGGMCVYATSEVLKGRSSDFSRTQKKRTGSVLANAPLMRFAKCVHL